MNGGYWKSPWKRSRSDGFGCGKQEGLLKVCRLDRLSGHVPDMDVKAAFKDFFKFFKGLEVLFNAPDLDVTVLSGMQVEADSFVT